MSAAINVWIVRWSHYDGTIIKTRGCPIDGKPSSVVIVAGTLKHQLLDNDWFTSEAEAIKDVQKTVTLIVKSAQQKIAKLSAYDFNDPSVIIDQTDQVPEMATQAAE